MKIQDSNEVLFQSLIGLIVYEALLFASNDTDEGWGFLRTNDSILKFNAFGIEKASTFPPKAQGTEIFAPALPSRIKTIIQYEDPMDGLYIIFENSWGICGYLDRNFQQDVSFLEIVLLNPEEMEAELAELHSSAVVAQQCPVRIIHGPPLAEKA